MGTPYLAVTVLVAIMVAFSGIGKVRRDPRQVKVINETVGVPLKYLPLLAACELAGAVGLLAGIRWPGLGVAAGIGLVIYFLGAVVSHLRVGDIKGVGPAVFMLALAAGALTLRLRTMPLLVGEPLRVGKSSAHFFPPTTPSTLGIDRMSISASSVASSPANHSRPSAPPSGRALEIGAEAPDFQLPPAVAGDRDPERLSDLRGSPVVLAFHPARWDPSWGEHVRAYNQLIARLPGAAGARLLSIAGDGPWRELTFTDHALEIPVVHGDVDNIAGAYGVAGEPAVFVIDAEGRVSWRHVASHTTARPDELAAALAALAPAAEHSTYGVTEPSSACTRRDFVAAALAAAFAITLAAPAARGAEIARAVAGAAPPPSQASAVTLHVNGRDVALDLDPRVSLLDALREYAGITGPKKGCDHGQCGACTVHVNGRRVLSCLTFAVMYQGKEITTIEGLAGGDALHPMQQAFIDHDGFQCGYCTSGQIMSATAMAKEPWGPRDDDVREAMSGNICRCGAYPGIVAAIQEVRGHGPAADGAATRRG